MKSNHILAVNNEEEGYLYIITGEEGENLNLFKRYILKYDVNSGEFHKYFLIQFIHLKIQNQQ